MFWLGQPIVPDGAEFPTSGGAHNPTPSPPFETPGNSVANTSNSLFSGAHGFVINNPAITVQHSQGRYDTIVQGMKSLSERIIEGAEYDSSLRDPPPQCHPGTRTQISGSINAWFRNQRRENLLLWLHGPAGVGKSAIIQTLAESLAEYNSIGATLFFSRLNNRNDPQRVFLTVAFQLATKISAYQTYITERIALDPSILGKGMREQFRLFITEPFGDKGIGKGEGSWAVLLDGLDECEGVYEQCKIVRLINEFVLEFPDAPLVWAIASRPEPHLVATFNEEAVNPSYWSEYVPVDSTGACRDVEHYLGASFKSIRKQFPHIPPSWPSETQFLKLTSGALGLFVFAKTAVRFMEDPNHADPVSRLDLLLLVIDRLDVRVDGDHPFTLLDALYTQILASIPASVWPTTKRILGLIICTQSTYIPDGLSYHLCSDTLLGISLVLGLKMSATYGSLHKLHSVLEIPDSGNAHDDGVSFLHASFGDYLTDQTRSQGFYIDRGESVDDIAHSLFNLYVGKPRDTKLEQYIHQLAGITDLSISIPLIEDVGSGLYFVITGYLRSKRGRGPFRSSIDQSECLNALSRLNLSEVFKLDSLNGRTVKVLFKLWDRYPEELENTGLFKAISLHDLKLEHLRDAGSNSIFFNCSEKPWRREYLNSSHALQILTTRLQEIQLLHPERSAIICGSSPEQRIALFQGDGFFGFPYPY